MNHETSLLINLRELRDVEAERVRREDDKRLAAVAAERARHEELADLRERAALAEAQLRVALAERDFMASERGRFAARADSAERAVLDHAAALAQRPPLTGGHVSHAGVTFRPLVGLIALLAAVLGALAIYAFAPRTITLPAPPARTITRTTTAIIRVPVALAIPAPAPAPPRVAPPHVVPAPRPPSLPLVMPERCRHSTDPNCGI